MMQHYRPEAYFRPGVTTVSVVSSQSLDVYRSKTFQVYTSPRSASEIGAGTGTWYRGVSWTLAGFDTYGLILATNSDCRHPYAGHASGPTPAPESNYEAPP